MIPDLTAALRTHFGFDSFRPGQAEAIQSLLSGRHTLAVMPTGAGKSLIYQLAALHLPGVTLVVSPLIALMKDQVDSLARRHVAATCINSAIAPEEQSRRLRAMADGAFRLVYVAPERLRSLPFREALRRVKVSLLAVDEAHCLSQWGHDFRPDYLHIAPARAEMGEPVTAALTATATAQVQADIVTLLGIPSAHRIVAGFNRPNLTFEVRSTTDLPAKLRALQALLAGLKGGAAIVYVGTRRDAEEVAEFVNTVVRGDGSSARPYHAGLDGPTRARVHEAFLSEEAPVIAATNAFGMGIDRADVRLVAHFSLPGTLEAYYQEAGRAGRDGAPARVALLYDPRDRALQERFIEHDAPSPESVRALFEVLRAEGRGTVRRTIEELSRAAALPEVALRVAVAQLETAGAVEHLGDEGAHLLLRPGAWDEDAMRATAAGVEERRQHRREQLARMVAYAEANECRRRILLDHFGDRAAAPVDACCDNCLARAAPPLAAGTAELRALSPGDRTARLILDAVQHLKWGVGRQKLAQMLKGSRARGMREFGYDRSAHFGRLAHCSLREIERLVESLIEQGYLKAIGSERPVLQLTPQGEVALRSQGIVPPPIPRRAEESHRGTVEQTARLAARGLTPAQIAAERGLTEGSVYGHLARLIAAGELSLDAVVPGAIVEQVRAAISQVGDVSALAPIKARLPDAISWGQIRCVVEAWKRDEPGPPEAGSCRASEPTRTQQAVLECVRSRRSPMTRAEIAAHIVGSPLAPVEALRDHPLYGWLYRRLYGRRTEDVAREVERMIEEGALTLDEQGRVLPLPAVAPARPTVDAISDFLSRPHPRALAGSWEAGWALDFHGRFAGAAWSRSPVGEMTYRLKYAGDRSALQPLVEEVLTLCAAHTEMVDVEALVPVPSSTARALEPVRTLADALGLALSLPIRPVLIKTRRTEPQKEMHTLAQKRANVAGAFGVQGDVHGAKLLVVDDLYDSGVTLEEVTRVLRRAGVARVCVLTLTRTIHTDG